MADLRDYQFAALDRVRQAVREGCKRLVLQMPTAAGKTRLAAEIVNGASAKKKRVIFAVPAISLIDQTVEMFYAEGITDVGVIQANHWMTDWSKPIQIASIQTLQKREPPMADVVIRDECHVLFKFDVDWMLKRPEWRSKLFIGLSATPWTRGLGKIYERLIVGETTKGLIDRDVLSGFKVFAPSHPDLKGVRIRAGDYVEADLEQVMKQDKLVGDIVQTWLQKAVDRPTICFCVNRAHAKMMAERFQQAGVPSAYMDCMTPMAERLRIRSEFKAGRVKIVCNVDIIGIGVDWPSIACISYCRPTRSEMRFVQNIGRGLRKAEGKTDLLVLDHSDTHLRLGFVTDITHEKLNDGKLVVEGAPVVPLPKACPKCGYLKAPRVSECPNCGFAVPIPACKIESKPGALEEFTGKKRAKAEQFTTEQKARFYAELQAYAISKSYRSGWAANKYRDKFKVWPRGSVRDVAPANAISALTLSWIKRSQIAWAKSKNNPVNGRDNGVGQELENSGSGVAGSTPVDVHAHGDVGGSGVS